MYVLVLLQVHTWIDDTHLKTRSFFIEFLYKENFEIISILSLNSNVNIVKICNEMRMYFKTLLYILFSTKRFKSFKNNSQNEKQKLKRFHCCALTSDQVPE